MGKIADAYVEIGADDKPFREQLKDLSYSVRRMSFNIRESLKEAFSADNIGNLVTALTGSGDAGWVASGLISAGFGKAMLVISGVAAAASAAALALDAVFSRDDDQKFADSVAGLTSGFRGLSEEIKHTDKKIAEIMSRDATGGNGGWFSLSSWKALGERIVGIETTSSQIARNMNNAATASKLFADNLVRGAIAGRDQSLLKRGAEAAAGLRRTAGQQEEMRINAAAFKNVMDEQGGVRVFEQVLGNLQKNPSLVPAGMAPKEEAMRVVGALEEGDLATTKLFGDMFNVAEERAKILADEFEKATGAGEELARIENQRIERQKDAALFQFDMAQRQHSILKMIAEDQARAAKARQKEIDEANKRTEQASKEMLQREDDVEKARFRMAEFEISQADKRRSMFNFQSLSQARDNLFNAAMDNRKDELTGAKMQTEIDRVVKALETFKLRWNMV